MEPLTLPQFGDTPRLQDDPRYSLPPELLALVGGGAPGPAAPVAKRNALSAGLVSGVHDVGALGGSALSALGDLIDLPQLQDYGKSINTSQSAASTASGRPDLDIMPWREGGVGLKGALPWVGYQLAKQVPQLAVQFAGAAALPELALPAAAGRLGALAPAILGGGRGLAADAALAAGENLAQGVAKLSVAGYPMAVGSMYQNALENPNGPQPGDAAWAAIMGVPYAMLDAIQPRMLHNLATKGLEGGLMKRVATAGAAGALEEIPQEAIQTAMELSFRPDMSTHDKMQQIVDAAITGGIVGGVLGGAAGSLRQRVKAIAANPTDANLAAGVDEAVNPPQPPTSGGLGPPSTIREQLKGAPQEAIFARMQNIEQNLASGQGDQAEASFLRDAMRDELRSRHEASPFNSVDPQSIDRALTAVQAQIDTGKFTEQDVRMRKELRDHQMRSSALGQSEMFDSSEAPVSLSPEATERAKQVAAVLKRVDAGITPQMLNTRAEMTADTEGKYATAISKMKAESKPEAVSQLMEKIANGDRLNRGQQGLAEHYGLLDMDGKERDLSTEIAQADKKVENLWNKAKRTTTDTDVQAAQAAQNDRNKLRDLQALHSDALRAHAGMAELLDPQIRSEFDTHAIERSGMAQPAPAERPSVVPLLPPAAMKMDMPLGEERKAELDHYKERMNQVIEDPQARADVRRDAETARKSILAYNSDSIEQAQNVLAVHGTLTKNLMFNAGTRPEAVRAPGARVFSDAEFRNAFDVATSQISADSRNQLKVVDSVDQLPPEVQAAANQQGFGPSDVRGVYHNGDMYIVKNNIRDAADVQETILHEVIGHGGARALLGSERYNIMDQLFTASGGLAGVRTMASKFGVKDALEQYIPKGTLTADQRVDVFDEFLAQVAGKSKGTLNEALMAWAGRVKQGLIRILDKAGMTALSARISKFSAVDVAAMIADMRAAARVTKMREEGTSFAAGTPQAMNEKAQAVIKQVSDKFNEVLKTAIPGTPSGRTVSAKFREAFLGWASINDLAQYYSKLFPQLQKYPELEQKRVTINARLAQMATASTDAYTAFMNKNSKLAPTIDKLMSYTQFKIDPRKLWVEHTWLHDSPNAANLERLVGEAREELFSLQRAGKDSVYTNIIASDQTMQMSRIASELYAIVALDPVLSKAIKNGTVNPMDNYIHSTESHDDAVKARAFWSASLTEQIKNIRAYVTTQRDLASTSTPSVARQIEARVGTLSARLFAAEQSVDIMNQFPNFHLGRHGDFYVAFQPTLNEDGKTVAPGMYEKIGKLMEAAGFTDASIVSESDVPQVYIRLETQDQAHALKQLALQMEKDKLVHPGSVSGGLRRDDITRVAGLEGNRDWLDKTVQALKAKYTGDIMKQMPKGEREIVEHHVNEMVGHFREAWLDQLSENSVQRVLTKRDNVPGYSKNMMANYAYRMRVSANALANLSIAPETSQSFADMRAAIMDAKRSKPLHDTVAMQQVFNEVMMREAQRPQVMKNNFIDKWRSVNHGYFLGFSPAYAVINLTQPGITLWPELAKKHGFVAAAKAMARATTLSFKVLRATINAGSEVSLLNATDAPITAKALAASGLSEADQKFIMRMTNTGNIDIGSFSRELARLSDRSGSGLDKVLRMAAAFGYYTETFTRLMAAFAARDLHTQSKADPATLDNYVTSTINESMFNYSNWNTARQTGRMGLAGPLSPVMFSFMTYQFQLTGKLFREVHQAFLSKASTPAEKTEARRFLGAHAVAMTTLAGTLGLPFASVMARVVDALGETLGPDDKQPWDVETGWQNFLSQTFGNKLGTALARGAPRLLNIDISKRAGEQDLMPFSKLLTDRRKVADAAQDWATQALGSPVGMLMNMAKGAEQLSQGNALQGMIAMVPTAIRGPTQAYSMSTQGYVDKANNKLPMTPGAGDILAQALGFKPAEKGAYDDLHLADITRRGLISRQAANIRQNLVTAIEQHDQAGQKEWIAQARAFDEKQPLYAVLPTIGAAVMSRAKDRGIASGAHVPLGANIKDPVERRNSGFADINWTR